MRRHAAPLYLEMYFAVPVPLIGPQARAADERFVEVLIDPRDLQIAHVDAGAVDEEPAEAADQPDDAPVEINQNFHVRLQRDPVIEAMAENYAHQQRDLEIAQMDAEAVDAEPAEVPIQAAVDPPNEIDQYIHVHLHRDDAENLARRQRPQTIPARCHSYLGKRVPKKVDRFGYQRFHCLKCHKFFVRTSMGHTSGLSYCSVDCFHQDNE